MLVALVGCGGKAATEQAPVNDAAGGLGGSGVSGGVGATTWYSCGCNSGYMLGPSSCAAGLKAGDACDQAVLTMCITEYPNCFCCDASPDAGSGAGGTQSQFGGGLNAPGGSAGAGGGPSCRATLSAPNPNEGRTLASCPATPPSYYLGPDAGVVTCRADADCSNAGSTEHCFRGQCNADQCLEDSDCPGGQACACRGTADPRFGGNECVEAPCHVNPDCGPQGVCSPSFSDTCRTRVDGYHCHSAADTCNTAIDCCGASPTCLYQPDLNHWACQAQPVCVGE
jgi:hypothetical protein